MAIQSPKFTIPVGTSLDAATRNAIQSAFDSLTQLNTQELVKQEKDARTYAVDSEVNETAAQLDTGVSVGYDPTTELLTLANPVTPILPIMTTLEQVPVGQRFVPKYSGKAPVKVASGITSVTLNSFGYLTADGEVTNDTADIASGEYVIIRCIFLGQPDPTTGLALAFLIPPFNYYLQP